MSQIIPTNSHHVQLKTKNSKLSTQLIVIAILLLATFLRVYELPTLPPGLNFDEAGNGVAALDILNGAPQLWWPIGGGKEPLWPYLLALATLIWGNIPLTLRLTAALSGIVTVAATYPLALILFRHTGRRQAELIGLLTMLGLATSGWHVHFSRLGFRAILLPLLSTLAFYFFWRGLNRAQTTHFYFHRLPSSLSPPTQRFALDRKTLSSLILAALLTALASYAYLAGRLLPLVPILFVGLSWPLNKISSYVSRRKSNSGVVMAIPHLF